MSDASENLALRQGSDPPRNTKNGVPVDRVVAFFKTLEPNLPAWAKEMYSSGRLVVGEIGQGRPDAFAECFNDGSYAVIITDGYLNLFQAVASDIAAAVSISPDLKIVEPLTSRADAVMSIASLLRQFQDGRVFVGHRLSTYSLPLGPEQQSWANNLAYAAGLFVFSHELGHVSIKVNKTRMVSMLRSSKCDARTIVILRAMLAVSKSRILLISIQPRLPESKMATLLSLTEKTETQLRSRTRQANSGFVEKASNSFLKKSSILRKRKTTVQNPVIRTSHYAD